MIAIFGGKAEYASTESAIKSEESTDTAIAETATVAEESEEEEENTGETVFDKEFN